MRTRIVAAACVLALLASGCGSRLDDDQLADGDAGLGGGPATSAPGDPGDGTPMFGDMEAPCGAAPEGFTPTASDTGVTADSIKIGVISDKDVTVVKLPTASIQESVEAFVGWCNSLGGINGRPLELVIYDSKLTEVKAVSEQACNDGLFALVGSGSVEDHNGAQVVLDCGLPDIAGYTVSVEKTTAANVITPVPNPPSDLAVGSLQYLAEQHPDAISQTAILGSSQVLSAWLQVQRIQEGWPKVGYTFTSVQDGGIFQESYAAEAQDMKRAGVRFVTQVSTTSETAKLLRDMAAQGFDPDVVFLGAQYYDPELLTEPASEGTYVELNTVPFEEAEVSPALQQFIEAYDAVGTNVKATSLGVQAFSAGLLFAQAAKSAGDDLTRDRLMEELKSINSWTGGGLHFETNPGDRVRSDCYLLMQVQGGEFTRVSPEEPGTYSCDPSHTVPIGQGG